MDRVNGMISMEYKRGEGLTSRHHIQKGQTIFVNDYTTAGVADPDKLHQTILDKGGRIKE